MQTPIEIELRRYCTERDTWEKQLNARAAKGFATLSPSQSEAHDEWLEKGQTRKLIFDLKKKKAINRRDNKTTSAHAKAHCIVVCLRVLPDASGAQIQMKVQEEAWTEIRCWLASTAEEKPPVMQMSDLHRGKATEPELEEEGYAEEEPDMQDEALFADQLLKAGEESSDEDEALWAGQVDLDDILGKHLKAKAAGNTNMRGTHFQGGWVTKNGKSQFVGICWVEGKWAAADTSFVRHLLPQRPGCRIQRRYPANGKVAWQCWYPPNNVGEPESHHCTGDDSLDRVVRTICQCMYTYVFRHGECRFATYIDMCFKVRWARARHDIWCEDD